MKVFSHEFTVECEIGKVWNFFVDPTHFEATSPQNLNEKLVSSTSSRLVEGTEVCISTNLFLKRTWHPRITKSEEPREYIDEVNDRPLKKWIHKHNFMQLEKSRTSVIDEITFEIGYGLVGRIIGFIVLAKLRQIFQYRERRTRQILQS